MPWRESCAMDERMGFIGDFRSAWMPGTSPGTTREG
jgi:hypothetical protein